MSVDTVSEAAEIPFWELDCSCGHRDKPVVYAVRGKVKCVITGKTADSSAYCIAVLISLETNPVCVWRLFCASASSSVYISLPGMGWI